MPVTKSALFVASLSISLCLTAAAENRPLQRPPARVQQAAAQPVTVPAPTPVQMPAAPPQVSFQNGMLTIVSQNSTLGDILRAVQARTGAAVDVPPNATERVVAHVGPGAARDVLASLLNGSHFNYVLLGSATDPNALDRVLLTPRTSATSPVEAAAQPPQAVPAQVVAGDDDDADADTDEDEPDSQADTQNPNQGQDEDEAQQVQPGAGQPGMPNVRTPDQLLQQLRQRQMQQQQGLPPGQPVPGQVYPGQPLPGGQPNPNQPNPNQPYLQPPN